MMKKTHDRQTRHLSQAIQLEESVSPFIVRSTMITVSAAILVFVVWASVTNINEIARTPGEVIPQGRIQVVQHLEGGIVKAVHASEGDRVQKGQLLITLDDSGSRDDLNRALSRQATLSMQEERLRAFSEQRDPDFSKFSAIHSESVKDQHKFFAGMVEARREEHKIVQEQITQKKRVIATLQSDLATAKNNYAIAKDLYGRRQTLNDQGYVSDVQFLQTKQNLNEAEGEMRQLQSRISVSRAEIGEFESRLSSLDAQRMDEAFGKLDEVTAELSENRELIEKLKARVARLEVRAPSAGLIKGMSVSTIGAVVQPGQTLTEIVPLDQELIVQVKIPPQYIGHLKTGQNVEIKFSSFDFSRYGFVPGTLRQISATTFSGANGERYYQGQVSLKRKYVGENPHNLVVPGMTVMADIVTGQKTVLDYLLKPIKVSMMTSFNER